MKHPNLILRCSLAAVLIASLNICSCGSAEQTRIRVALDPSLARQPHADLIRALALEFQGRGEGAQNPEPFKVTVPTGISSGQVIDLEPSDHWLEKTKNQAGVWKISGRGDDGRVLVSGETPAAAGQRDVSITLHDSLPEE